MNRTTYIYYSLLFCVFGVLVGIVGLGIGINGFYFLAQHPDKIDFWNCFAPLAFSIFGIYSQYRFLPKVFSREPQIILNKIGMQTFSSKFYKWDEIKNEGVVVQGSGKSQRVYLVFSHPDGTEKVQIDFLNTSRKSLNKLLAMYRKESRGF